MDAARFLWAVVAAMAVPSSGVAAAPLILNCEVTEGASGSGDRPQIMIDEEKGIVIYHYHPSRPDGIVRTPEGGLIDLTMKITMKNEHVVLANDTMSAFVITKHDGRFVKAFVTPFPLKDGKFLALGNTLWGKCSKSPFH